MSFSDANTANHRSHNRDYYDYIDDIASTKAMKTPTMSSIQSQSTNYSACAPLMMQSTDSKIVWGDMFSHIVIAIQHNIGGCFRRWKTLTVSLCVVFGIVYRPLCDQWLSRKSVDRRSEWKWDHNGYHPVPGLSSSSSSSSSLLEEDRDANRNLLIAQISGTSALTQLAKIASRPNQAYARQWGRDYVQVYGHNVPSRDCLETASVIKTLTEQQETNPQSIKRVVRYDAVVLLPADAIIMDLDFDLLTLIPQDKLMSVSQWQTQSDFIEILFFNLRHEHAYDVSHLWYEMLRPLDVTCGAGNDMELLMESIVTVTENQTHSTIHKLEESREGFVGGRVIKEIQPTVPMSKAATLLSNLSLHRMELQTTADSVCYRYYPKCEVIGFNII